MNRRPLSLSAAALVAGFGLSCATAPSTTATTETTTTGQASTQAPPPDDGSPVVGPPEVAWQDMTDQQKGRYMGKVVVPRMSVLFREFDEKEFPKVGCKTCHGPDAKERKFEMPNPKLEELPATQEGWAELQKEHPEWLKFMGEKVKPEMAKLLSMPENDPTNPNPQPGTVGCSTCHPMAGAPAKP